MKKTYRLVFLWMILFTVNLKAQDGIKSDQYWFVANISDDLYEAKDTNCTQHIYNNSDELLMSLESDSAFLEHIAGNIYVVLAKKANHKDFYNYSTYPDYFRELAYYHFNQGKLKRLEIDEAKRLYLGDELFWLFTKNLNKKLYDGDLNLIQEEKRGQEIQRHKSAGAYYWVDDRYREEIKVYSIKDNQTLLTISGKEYDKFLPHKLRDFANGIWSISDGEKYYLYDKNGLLSEEGFENCRAKEGYLQRDDDYEYPKFDSENAVIIVAQKAKDGELHYGLFNPLNRTYVLPAKYEDIYYGSYGRIETKSRDNELVSLFEMRDGKLDTLIPEKYKIIDVIDEHTALVKHKQYWLLYNLDKRKCLEIGFDEYELTKHFLQLKRFGEWSAYNLKTQEFEFLLGELDEIFYKEGDWIVQNYSYFDPERQHVRRKLDRKKSDEKPKNRRLEMFGASEMLGKHRLINPTRSALFYNPNNLEQKIVVKPQYRAQPFMEYLLFQNDKGFHIIDTSGKYLTENQAWEAAVFIKFRHATTLYCLVLDDNGVGLFNVADQSIRYFEITEGRGENQFFRFKNQGKMGCVGFPRGAKNIFILEANYQYVKELEVMRDGSCIIQVINNGKAYWVDEQGNKLSNCD
ncbi:MAG: hypothetical protein MK212_06025 [Saprospiraceae bacterium]|nr:hypothetical protein [Saprospiraceae bacterium]